MNYIKSVPLLEQYYGTDINKWPEVIKQAKTKTWKHTITALGIAISYLEEALIAKQTLMTSEYGVLDLDEEGRLMLDSQALEHLEILEVQGRLKAQTEGSLLDYLDKTVTPFGKREIRRWICAPLYNTEGIIKRQDAIKDLVNNQSLLNCICKDLQRLPDLERKISLLYTYSVKQAKSPIVFENMNLKRLLDLKEVLNGLEQVKALYVNIAKYKEKIISERLRVLTKFVGDGGIVPEFSDKMKVFKEVIDWSKLGKDTEIPEPNGGVDEDYDNAQERIKDTKEKLNEELVKWQEFFKDKSISYVHKKEVIVNTCIALSIRNK